MAKQLIGIEARHLKSEDLIFDFRTRKVQRIEYVSFEKESGDRYCGIGSMTNVHVSYGLECNVSDNFSPDYNVLILIETDDIETIAPCNIVQ